MSRPTPLISNLGFALVALLLAFAQARFLVGAPGYTDAFYHFNSANRLLAGDGLTDATLTFYLDLPETLPAPSHRYWMPLTSMLAALGMSAMSAPFSHEAAQVLFVMLAAGSGILAFALARLLGGGRALAWAAGILTVTGGYYASRWGAIDTFAPYAFFGSLTLILIGLGARAKHHHSIFWALAGASAGMAHLTRPDGLLLMLSGVIVILAQGKVFSGAKGWMKAERLRNLALFVMLYLVVMLPWFLRNLEEMGAILPTAGLQTIGFTEYEQFFSISVTSSPADIINSRWQDLLSVRWHAAAHGLATLVAVEGIIVLTPFMLVGIWRRRRSLLLRGFWIFALGIHLLMILVFPVPGSRGGLFHATAALFPFWMTLGVLGLDDAVVWTAKRRAHWHPVVSRHLFLLLTVGCCLAITLAVALPSRVTAYRRLPDMYADLRRILPADARIMINDPAKLYYFLGVTGVALPNEPVKSIAAIARKYDIDYLLLEGLTADGVISAAPRALQFDVDDPPPFLRPVSFTMWEDVRLYEILYP